MRASPRPAGGFTDALRDLRFIGGDSSPRGGGGGGVSAWEAGGAEEGGEAAAREVFRRLHGEPFEGAPDAPIPYAQFVRWAIPLNETL